MAANLITPDLFDINNKQITLTSIDNFDWKKIMAIYNYSTNQWIFKFSSAPYIRHLGGSVIGFDAQIGGMSANDEIGVFYLTISTGSSGGSGTANINSMDLSWMQ